MGLHRGHRVGVGLRRWTLVRPDRRSKAHVVKRQGSSQRIVCNLIDKPHRQRLACGDGFAGHNHVQRCLDSDQPWQPLRATRAGDDTQNHLGQSHLRFGDCDAITAGQCDFKPAPQRRAVDRRNRGDRKAGQVQQDIVEVRFNGRLGELFGIRTGDKGFACSGHDQPVCAPCHRCLHPAQKAPPNFSIEKIQRRIVDGQDCRTIAQFKINRHVRPHRTGAELREMNLVDR